MDSSPKCHYLSLKSPNTTASFPKSTHSGNSEKECGSDSEREISKSQKPPSATSKAAKTHIRKSKILTERNEDSSPNSLDFNSSLSGTNLLKFQSIDSGNNDEEGENCFRPDDSPTLKPPYDPIKNYLSPRPKFLRYRPNRRREINLGLEEEVEGKEEEELSLNASTVTFDSQKNRAEVEEESGSLGSCSQETELRHGSVESENLEDEEDEEFEEREPWNLKWVSKILLLFLVLILSTAYISSINSPPIPPPSLQYMRNLSIEYQTVEIGFPQTELFDYFGDEHGFRKTMDKIPEIHFVQLAAVPEIGFLDTELPEDGMMVEDPDEVFEVLEEVEKQGRNESNHEEETGGDLLSILDLSYVSLFSLLDDHHEPPLLPPMSDYDLVSGPSCGSSSYPLEEEALASSVTFDKGTATIHEVDPTSGAPEEANKTIEGGMVPEVKKAIDHGVIMENNIVEHNAAAPAKAVLEKLENDYELQATMDYMSGFAPDSLLYGFVISFSAMAYVLVKLFLKRRRARRSPSSNVNVGSDEGARGEMTRRIRSRSVEEIEQVEEGLPRMDPVTPLIIDRSAGVELLSEFKVGGGVGRKSSEITDHSIVYNNVNTEEKSRSKVNTEDKSRNKVGPEEKSRSKVGAGLSGVVKQQPFTSTADIHSYGSFIGQEFISVGKVHDGKGEARTTTPTSVRRSTRIRNRGAKSP